MQALLQRQQPCACTQLRPTARAGRVRYTCAAGSSAQAVTSHASQLQQIPSSRRAVLEGILAVVAATAWRLQSPGAAAAAAGGPRDLTPEQQEAVNRALAKVVTKAKAPVVLRLAYHDAGTFSKLEGDGGLNASIQYELSRPENFGLKRGWGVLQQAMAALKGTPAEGAVSYADLIALAGAHAVAVTGGPRISVPVGRADAAAADPLGRMAAETSGAQALKDNFAAKGFSVRELVALSGAHTLGGKGFGDPVTFDNAYYTALLAKPWLNTADEMSTHIGLPSDHVLPEDPECLPIIQEYAGDTAAFYRDFAAAYTKMTMMGAQWV